jgi:lipopolysaccharide heptosyltransferase II
MKQNSSNNKILIINPFGIGDVIFTTPIIESIKIRYPDSYIGYLCNIRTAPLLYSNPNIDKVFIVERDEYRQLWQVSKAGCIRKLTNLFREAVKEHFDTVVDFSMSREYGFFAMLSGVKKRIGYDYRGRGLFLTDKVKLNDGYKDRHVIDYHKDFLPLISRDLPVDTLTKIYISEEDDTEALRELQKNNIYPDDKYVCLVPGAGGSWGNDAFRKRWPVDRFQKVVSDIYDKFNFKVVLLGSIDEKELCSAIKDCAPDSINLCGCLSLMVSAAIIRRAIVLIANDGGPLHIACALGTKTVSIFGPVDEKVYGPYTKDDKHAVVVSTAECRPCYRGFKIPACNDIKCLNDVSPDDVVGAFCKTIKRKNLSET